ncbi:hypothetical protein GPA19_24295 [Azoarcus indigens]|uniref:Uncharacterized protein n=1 Tax=Azoarcus indigens TaxID=29545 RepID=A0A4R6DJL4_9RHOO|nr:hypothetical protein [Azoarcus indigens]NMG68063.1 hypothetical protein [Azoarcus indigens]TDN44961.1 hypothetical protein C7389_1336 [Azoarcus indigens]
MPIRFVIDARAASADELAEFQLHQEQRLLGALAGGPQAGQAGRVVSLEYRLPRSETSQAAVPPATAYQETMATLRYYGGVRYILLPIYLSIVGALAGQYYKSGNPVPEMLLICTGIFLSLLFLVFEIGLSKNLKKLWAAVGEMLGNPKDSKGHLIGPLAHRDNAAWLSFLRWALAAPYVVGVLLGGYAWLGR